MFIRCGGILATDAGRGQQPVVNLGETDQKPGIGPALALLEASRTADVKQIHWLAHTLGTQTLSGSAGELLRRMLIGADTIDDLEGLEDLHEMVHHPHAYRLVAIRTLERLSPWSLPLKFARTYGCSLLSWHISRCHVEAEYLDASEFQILVPSPIPQVQQAFALGVAYTLTLLAEELADFQDADMDDRISAYRAAAAREFS